MPGPAVEMTVTGGQAVNSGGLRSSPRRDRPVLYIDTRNPIMTFVITYQASTCA
jgi:hypothetical protein